MVGSSTLVIVDDDPDTRTILNRVLDAGDYRVLLARSGEEALRYLGGEDVQLVLTDMVMPGMDGLALTRRIKRDFPEVAVMIITAYASIETAVEAMRAGAFDYITKPVIPEELRLKVDKAVEQCRMRRELGALKLQLSKSRHPPNLIGVSDKMRQVFQLVNLVSVRDVPVVVTGESGTGKELVAKAIHALSNRSAKAFVPLNCGAIPEALLESELFGYVRGAFTGASTPKKGLFEEADGGTLFLDEIVDTPLPIQTKLLRALQDGKIRRLGSTKSTATDVRVIVATNKDLNAAIGEGVFREDLYYRLNVVNIHIPPLRERMEDIPLLTDHFIGLYQEAINPAVKGISPEAQATLARFDWPGNVRELENTIRRALVLCRTEVIMPEDVVHLGPHGLEGKGGGGAGQPLSEAAQDFQRAYFLQLLELRKGNVRQVSEDAGISRKSVYEYLKRLDIDPSTFRTAR